MGKLFSVIFSIFVTAFFVSTTLPTVQAQLRSPTSLTLSPSIFEMKPSDSITLTATLASNGTPLEGKLIAFTFVALGGSISPLSGTTDVNGQVEVTYTAPLIETSVTITATFVGDLQYLGGTVSSSGTVSKIPTTLMIAPSNFTLSSGDSITLTTTLTSEGSPLEGKEITFTTLVGTLSPTSETTNPEGEVSVTCTAPEVIVDTPVTIVATFLGDFEYLGSTATSTGTIEAEAILPIPEMIGAEGAAFCIPESVKDDISNFAISIPKEIQNLLPIPIPTTGFLLVDKENLSLVLAQESDKGLASVEGWVIPSKITLGGFELSVIVAESVSFVKDGTSASIGEILVNPERYKFELVKISATRRHISILYDPDDGSSIEFPVTAGYLVEEPEGIPELVKGAIRKGKELILNASRGIVQGIVIREKERLPVFDFETDYWIDCPVETNGIVLPSGSRILNLLENVVPEVSELIHIETDLPVLYDVKTSLVYEPVSSVQEIKLHLDEYEGKIVGLTAYGYQGTVSIQEALREAIPCHHVENWIEIETPEGPVCLPIPLDVRLEGMITWNRISIPPEREEILIAAGASSIEQDRVFETDLAEFRLVGKIISTKLIDESLPEALALIIFEKEKLRDITLDELVMERIEENLAELNWTLTNFTEEAIPQIPVTSPPSVVYPIRPVVIQTPEEIPQIRISVRVEVHVEVVTPELPLRLEIDNSKISEVFVDLKQRMENVRVTVEKLDEKPAELPEPLGLVWAYHQIDMNVPEDAIENAGINFWVLKEWLATHEVGKENITLIRFFEGGWKELTTEIIGENATHIQYSAMTPGFSTFAITAVGAIPEEEVPEEEKPEGIDPILIILGAVIGVIAVVALIVLLRRRKRGRRMAQGSHSNARIGGALIG